MQSELERVKAQKSLTMLPTGEIKKHLLGSDRELVALRQGKYVSCDICVWTDSTACIDNPPRS